LPTLLSPGYVADSDSDEGPNEDPREDPVDYTTDGGDDADDESSDDDDNDDDEEEEEQEASEDDDEEEEHPTLTDSFVVPVDDPVPSAKDTKAFETDEFAPTSVPSPRRSTAKIPSPPLPLPSPPTTSPTYAEAPLGYKAAGIRLRAVSPPTHHPSEIPSPPLLLPYTTHRDDLLEVDMPLWKRARFTAPTGRFEVGESSTVAAARQVGHTLSYTVDYGFIDTIDASIRASESRAMTAVGVVNERVTDLAAT
ncbi:hypothetical protein Tco_1053535, partial [Tanacetum coccineum]